MRNNKKKFCFIICVNDEGYLNECQLYINRLRIPDGYSVEIKTVYKAKSMADGYNRGMGMTDAKYKIYMHQDVFIINPNFLIDVVNIFKINWKIGMIGLIGNPILSPSAIVEYSDRVGNVYALDSENVNFEGYEYKKYDQLYEVDVIDGMLMITKEDIPWRSDLFDGWDYYDLSQSYEFKRRGFKVVVPEQRKPWCIHDDNSKPLWFINKYRKIFIDEYLKESQ